MGNLFTIFVSPEMTFQRLKSSKLAWLICLIALMVISLAVIYLEMPIIEQTVLDSLKSNPQISPENYDSIMDGNRTFSYVIVIITSLASVFFGGLLFMLLNLIVRGEAKYMQLVTVAAFASLPGMIDGILTAILLKATNAQAINDISISLGAFIQDKGSILFKVLSIINPFSIWTLVLYIIGASVMMNRPKKQVAVWIVITWIILSFGSLLLL
ncbi:YIP1 family protein [Paenibacillus motobuensis]|uniref:YIP1 family protein n=1 Tax=Paenibacillus TaxID=44249 RepID=UPI00203CF49A|nr:MULTISPECIES: YIP1 family protein [Paenibacillus]MCM3041535.1 YIP1 family protein [Paenibacillus lutimineralis]MCM3648639.1 YIP1 family protein [Paenibacillus motobuensis]